MGMPMLRHRYANSKYFLEKRSWSRFFATYGSRSRMLKGISRTSGSRAASKLERRSLVWRGMATSLCASSLTSTLTRRCRTYMSSVLKNRSYRL
nr:MAG: hypothetical protein [Molluscum contagiosum virus]